MSVLAMPAAVGAVPTVGVGLPRTDVGPTYVEGSDPAAPLFDPTAVIDVDFVVSQESIDALTVDPVGDYQVAQMTVTTVSATFGPWDVGLRLKGGIGSFRDLTGKSAFKVKVNDVDRSLRLLGLKKLTLNNMVQDPSMMHEAMGYRFFRAMGIAAPRVGYANVTINGTDYGLHANIETPDDVMLERWYPTTQHLYEGAYWTDVHPGSENAFEVDEGDEDDRSDLTALIAAANAHPSVWWSELGKVADREQFVRMWAVERLIGHWDGYHSWVKNNYYLHSDETGRFTMLPWGIDQTFHDRLPWPDSNDHGLMFTTCMRIPVCYRLFHAELAQAITIFQSLDLTSMSTAIEAGVLPAMVADTRREYDEGSMQAWRDSARQFIAERPLETAGYLAQFTPAAPTVTTRRVGAQIRIAWAGGEHPAFPATQVEAQVVRRGQSFARAVTVAGRNLRLPVGSANGVRVRLRTINEVGVSPWSVPVRITL
jgi:hypothetical protein